VAWASLAADGTDEGLPVRGAGRRVDPSMYSHIFVMMPTTVHIPQELLDRADARAKALGISRNRLIVEALEARLAGHDSWPDEFVAMLRQPLEPSVADEADEMFAAIRNARRSRRKPPRL